MAAETLTQDQTSLVIGQLEIGEAFRTVQYMRTRMERAGAQPKWIKRADETGEVNLRHTLQSPDSDLNITYWEAEDRLNGLLRGYAGQTAMEAATQESN